jgi:hypothetical protein
VRSASLVLSLALATGGLAAGLVPTLAFAQGAAPLRAVLTPPVRPGAPPPMVTAPGTPATTVPGAAPVLAPASPTPAGAVPASPPPGSVVPQTGTPAVAAPTPGLSQQELYDLYLSQLYGSQAVSAPPESRSEAAKQAADYLTNGAAATSVPTSGPAAQYFTNGSQVTTVATSAIPNYSFAPAFTPAPQEPEAEAGAPPAIDAAPLEQPVAEDAGAPAAPANTSPSSPAGQPPPGPSESAPTPGELTSVYASLLAAYPAPTVPAPGPSALAITTTERPTESPPAEQPGPVARREAHHAMTAAVVTALVGGIALGALLVFLGSRLSPRQRYPAGRS